MEAWWCSLFKKSKIVLHAKVWTKIQFYAAYTCYDVHLRHDQIHMLSETIFISFVEVLCFWAQLSEFVKVYCVFDCIIQILQQQVQQEENKNLGGLCPLSIAVLSLVLSSAVSAITGYVSPTEQFSAVGALSRLQHWCQSLYIFTVYMSEILLQPELRLVSSTEHLQHVKQFELVRICQGWKTFGVHMDKSFWLSFLCKEPGSCASTLLCNQTNTCKWEGDREIHF